MRFTISRSVRRRDLRGRAGHSELDGLERGVEHDEADDMYEADDDKLSP